MNPKRNSRNRKPRKPFDKEQKAQQSKSTRVCPDERDDRNLHTSQPNDWRWYAQNEQLVKDYASYPFGVPLGNRLSLGYPNMDNISIPGLMAIHFVPSIGVATAETSPINVAMRRLYSFVRHANSGASNYDAPDLMLYMICVDSAMMFHSMLKRAYGVMLDYTALNRYYPRALVEAMNLDFDDLQAHLNDLRGYINQYAVKLSQLWTPNSMSFMARHIWMCEGVYVDSLTEKAQSYMYVPDAFYKFGLTDGVGSADLEFTRNVTSTPLLKFDSIVSFGDALLNPMIANEDFGIMSGDILKAFGRSGIIQVQGITDTYQVVPVYSQEVLSQIENTTLITTMPITYSAKITQETAVGTGWLKSQPTCTAALSVGYDPGSVANRNSVMDTFLSPYTNKKILNLHHGDVQPQEVMVATRNLSFLSRTEDTTTVGAAGSVNLNAVCKVTTCGSEVFLFAQVFYYLTSDTGLASLTSANYSTAIPWSINPAKSPNVSAPTKDLGLISAFDWHPGFVPFLYIISETDGVFTSPYGMMQDFDFFTTLDESNVQNMHYTALLSELSIPTIG